MRKISEQFDNKDYGEYFSALQNSLERKSQQVQNFQPEMHKTKRVGNRLRLRPWVYVAMAILPVFLSIFLVLSIVLIIALPPTIRARNESKAEAQQTENTESDVIKAEKTGCFAEFTDNTATIAADIESGSIIVINCETNEVVASRDATVRCYPASTTKIMTILTAVDYITDYDETFTFSFKITDPLYLAEATVAGFSNGEAVNMTDMLYGAILPSGADATVGLALSIAGSEEEFVKLMNKKADELGLKDTHFTNSSGLYDKNHYTTAEDMAVIIRAAMEDDLCRKVLSAYRYTTEATPQHPEGIELTSTLFSYMYGTEPEGADILGGKTGFVNESGYCIASFGESDSGSEYVCVTLKGVSLWPTVYDQIDLYSQYAK